MPCYNGATCVDFHLSFMCQCTAGFSGGLCEISEWWTDSQMYAVFGHDVSFLVDVDECLSMPCKNGATCEDLVYNYTCNCYPGFTGRLCETGIIHYSVCIVE